MPHEIIGRLEKSASDAFRGGFLPVCCHVASINRIAKNTLKSNSGATVSLQGMRVGGWSLVLQPAGSVTTVLYIER